jgi:hypothetical protein
VSIGIVVARHRFDADPDPDPTLHVDSDPNPDPDSTFVIYCTAMLVYIVLSFSLSV